MVLMDALRVEGLCKQYPGFALREVSFSVQSGRIAGFIGRNGAGKTTTLKALLNLVHPDSGRVAFFGQPFGAAELAIKQRIGFVSGGIDYYSKKRLGTITAVTRRFYDRWDETAYRRYLQRFDLAEGKTPSQLSAGMRVKYALALALSHRAELLILDEPTSGLDPVSREDLLEAFLELAAEGIGILFSTHITSDLEKCADDIIYIRNGAIIGSGELAAFREQYRLVRLTPEEARGWEERLIGRRRAKEGITALVRAGEALPPGTVAEAADLEAIMVHSEKE